MHILTRPIGKARHNKPSSSVNPNATVAELFAVDPLVVALLGTTDNQARIGVAAQVCRVPQ